jgi:hypothetical protein
MGAEGPLPCSQKPTTCPYLCQIDPVHAPVIFFKLHFNIICPSISRFASHERSHFSRYKALLQQQENKILFKCGYSIYSSTEAIHNIRTSEYMLSINDF